MSDTADSNKIALVLVPHAGGDRVTYAPLVKGLSGVADVYFYEMPGHGKRAGDPFADSYEDLLFELLDLIRDVAKTHEKYVLCGDSLGAYLCDNAYERLLEEGGKLPSHVVYGAVNPGKGSGDFSIEEIIEKSSDTAILNSDNVYSRYLKNILEKDLELLIDGNAGFKAHLQCPMSFFMGKEDRLLGKVYFDWSELAGGGYREYLFEGEHLFMTSNKNVITALMKVLERLQG
ncbi:MAG: hypothetical protein E7307_10600 [Butyrivibrio sp.]|nr:hypothetical protein [Butyrivibrio sp.]